MNISEILKYTEQEQSGDVDKQQTSGCCIITEVKDEQRHLLVFTGRCSPRQ